MRALLKSIHSRTFQLSTSFLILFSFFLIWSYRGIAEAGLSADFARDLSEISNLWIHRIVWLGPQLRVGFPASPIYYYLFFPILLLSGGSGYSLVITHTFFAVGALWFWTVLSLQKKNSKTTDPASLRQLFSTLLVALAIGFSPWWITAAAHPWNGHMYVIWLLMGLVSFWFELPFLLSSLLLGTAIAIHPAAVLVMPIVVYEWFSNKKKLFNAISLVIGLLIPWGPIILFEIITKGYLTRMWLQHPSAGFTFAHNLYNVRDIIRLTEIPNWVAIGIWLVTLVIAQKKQRAWWIALSLSLTIISFASLVHQYYLMGMACAITFLVAVTWCRYRITQLGLIVIILFYSLKLLHTPLMLPERSIVRMDEIVGQTILLNNLDQSKTYAVLNMRDPGNSTPQADDYRFFLRTHGIKTLNIDNYPQADRLLVFVEFPNFDWEHWQDWHTQRFGDRKFVSVYTIDGVDAVLFDRK
jgi:hypothetical protein